MQKLRSRPILQLLILFLVLTVLCFYLHNDKKITPESIAQAQESSVIQAVPAAPIVVPPVDLVPIPISHITTPEPLKGIYMTSWVAGTDAMRDHVIDIADKTEVNAIVFDIKDSTGRISYPVEDPALKVVGSDSKRIPNLRDFTNLLHSKGIYVIGRIAAFQDPYFVGLHPEYAVKTGTDNNKVWKDAGGIAWLDAGEQPVWDYLVSIAKDAYAQGVDEVQFDYVRYPSDGTVSDVFYPASDGKTKADVINSFFEYVHNALAGTGVVTSADLFGLTTTSTGDMGIGQIIENALRNFDYVSPMVYPSHFAPGSYGFKDPQSHPYEVVKTSMSKAAERAQVINVPVTKLRPWLQEFGLFGETYGSTQIKEQIQAVYDSGLTSWLLWDPTNKYSAGGLESDPKSVATLD